MAPRGRSEHQSVFTARIPRELEDIVQAYSDAHDVSFSEAVRRLLVKGLEAVGAKHTRTDEHGTREETSWTLPSGTDETTTSTGGLGESDTA